MSKFGVLSALADEDRHLLNFYEAYIVGPRDMTKEAEALTYILTRNEETLATGERDRTFTWSASASGSCLRRQQFTYLGKNGRANGVDSQNIFINGDFLHLRYQMVGLIQGWLKDVEVPLALPEYGVRGTMDGDLGPGVLELKSINRRGFARVSTFGPDAEHKRQATSYMLATGYDFTRFIYESKDDNARAEFLYKFDQETADDVIREWNLLNELKDSKKLYPMQRECLQEKGDYRRCPFAKVCEGAKWPRVVMVND